MRSAIEKEIFGDEIDFLKAYNRRTPHIVYSLTFRLLSLALKLRHGLGGRLTNVMHMMEVMRSQSPNGIAITYKDAAKRLKKTFITPLLVGVLSKIVW